MKLEEFYKHTSTITSLINEIGDLDVHFYSCKIIINGKQYDCYISNTFNDLIEFINIIDESNEVKQYILNKINNFDFHFARSYNEYKCSCYIATHISSVMDNGTVIDFSLRYQIA